MADAPPAAHGAKVREVIKYRCPACNGLTSSIEEALAHCPSTLEQEETGSTRSSEGAGAAAQGAAAAEGLPSGEAVAYDDQGRPSIIRQVDGDTGYARTIVRNDDGSHRVFGESTVNSLTNSSGEEAARWACRLTNHQLRGLVHEVGQRLLDGSRLYHTRLAELKKLGDKLNYQYFGLSPEATERDLDNAYRKLAKKMHPDKNGGTEDAKRRFQHMKERYEALKKSRGENEEAENGSGGEGNSGDKDRDQAAEQGDKGDQDAQSGDAEGRREGEEDQKSQGKSTSIEYDPTDKDSMVKTVSKMVRQLKNIDIQMDVLIKELTNARTQLPLG